MTPNETPAAPPPAATLSPSLSALKAELEPLVGPEATFALEGKLPVFQLPPGTLPEACRKLKAAGFDYLILMTAVDYPDQQRFELVYVLSNFSDAREIGLVASVDRQNPVAPSVSAIWDTADWHEREVYDLFGIRFENHPDLRRILLDDRWEGYPLRKDYEDKVHNVIKRPY